VAKNGYLFFAATNNDFTTLRVSARTIKTTF
jgi:ribosomal protein L28